MIYFDMLQIILKKNGVKRITLGVFMPIAPRAPPRGGKISV